MACGRKKKSIPFKIPKNCPVCNSLSIRKKDDATFRCTNYSCTAKITGSIEHYVSKNSLNIDGLGIKIIDLLLSKKIIEDAGDLYNLNLEELSQTQYPAVLIQTSEELREDAEIGSGARTRMGTIDFVVLGFVKGSNTNIDTLRNALITAIETALETDITRDSNALDTEVVHVETDEGTLFPVGGVVMTIRCIYKYLAGTPSRP